MTTRRAVAFRHGAWAGALLGCVVALALPGGAAAQQAADTTAKPAAPPPELVFEREVFDYPSYERRNPFKPLTSNESGPRFEDIQLEGIIYSPDPKRSVALLSAGNLQQGAPAPGAAGGGAQSRRVRIGESWGNVRVVEIHRAEIVVDVNEFGTNERRTLQLARRKGQGGS